jgi:hypothetical protein
MLQDNAELNGFDLIKRLFKIKNKKGFRAACYAVNCRDDMCLRSNMVFSSYHLKCISEVKCVANVDQRFTFVKKILIYFKKTLKVKKLNRLKTITKSIVSEQLFFLLF